MTFNHLNRRLHLYLSLSLLPWFLVYALSSLVIQHRSLFTDNPKAKWTSIRTGIHPPDSTGESSADGSRHAGRARPQGLFRARRAGPERLIVTRFDFFDQTRLTYHIGEQRLVVEGQRFGIDHFLIFMHIRAGWVQESFLSDLWAIIVDVVCIAFVVWVATGLYMWWLLPATRRWGLLALGAGWVTFAVFVLTL